MKKINNLLFASLIISIFIPGSFSVKASENLEVVIIENENIIRMEVENPSSEVMDIYLYNNNKKEIFSKRVGLGETLESQYDFTKLKNGTYTLVSEVAHMRLNRVIEVKGSQANLVDSYYSFMPVFAQKDDRLLVHYVNNGEEDIGISIENTRGEIFDAFYDNNDLIFTQTFSLENLEAGNYTFHFISKGNFHTHEFEVE